MELTQIYAGILSLIMLCTGCANANNEQSTEISSEYATLFSDRDFEIGYDEQTANHITLNGNDVNADTDSVTVHNGVVTIGKEGTYILSGTLDAGMIVVNVGETEKVQLVLDNVNITSPTSAAIYIPSADKVFITTASDSVNTLKNGGSYEAIDDNNIDGVIFAKSDLTLNGAGTLQISADVEHGVVTKDDLTITSGTYDISVAGHGLSGKDAVAIADGTFTLNTGKDGIQSDNTEDTEKGYVYLGNGSYNITSEGDGVSASSYLAVENGTYEIIAGGGYVNGESHQNNQMGGGMRPSQDMNGEPPQLPEGQTFPDGTERPERPNMDNMTPPEGMDGEFTPPDSTQTEAAETTTDTITEDTVSTKGFKAGTELTILNGNFTLDCADDCFHSDGNLTYSDGNMQASSGCKAFHADVDLTVQNGDIEIITCFEGLEGQNISVNGGDIDMYATDDGLNAASDTVSNKDDININITGGTLTIDAGGDGLDSNGNLNMSGGTVLVSSAAMGADSPLDYDGSAAITGGILLGIGIDGMAQDFASESTQCSVLTSIESQEAGSTITISDKNGTSLITYEAPKSFSSIVFSCPELIIGNTYTVTAGTSQTDITLEETITGSGGMNPNQFGGKGNRGQKPTS